MGKAARPAARPAQALRHGRGPCRGPGMPLWARVGAEELGPIAGYRAGPGRRIGMADSAREPAGGRNTAHLLKDSRERADAPAAMRAESGGDSLCRLGEFAADSPGGAAHRGTRSGGSGTGLEPAAIVKK